MHLLQLRCVLNDIFLDNLVAARHNRFTKNIIAGISTNNMINYWRSAFALRQFCFCRSKRWKAKF